MKKALQVTEIGATWWEEGGFYIAEPNGKHRVYERCLTCGTELQEKMEFPNFRLPDDGQIQKQRSESFDDLIIEWKVVTKMLGAGLGHGVQFRYPGVEGILIGFIDGFGWHPKVNVFILSAESEFWGSYTNNPQKILRTLKECVHLVLQKKNKTCDGIIKDNIFCLFNA
jgi:hypothetical protein